MTGTILSVSREENKVRVRIVTEIACCIPLIQVGDCVSITRVSDTDELRAYEVIPCVDE